MAEGFINFQLEPWLVRYIEILRHSNNVKLRKVAIRQNQRTVLRVTQLAGVPR